MAVLQNDGRIALAVAVATQPIHLAWGRGRPAWDSAPEPEPNNATSLIDEVGRRTATQVGYVVPDANGEIELPSGARYTSSAVPTRWVYVRFTFSFGDAAGQDIRELGIFLGSKTDPALPAGQRYFTPAQVTQPGRLYALDREPKLTRNGSVRQHYEYVLPF